MRQVQIQILSRQTNSGVSMNDYSIYIAAGKYGYRPVEILPNGETNNSPYAMLSAQFDHSLVQSNLLSKVTLICSQPYSKTIGFQGGQPVRVWDNEEVVFDGVIVRPIYYIKNQMQYCDLVLGTYTYQLTKMPLFFTADMLTQLSELLGLPNLGSSVAGNVSVPVNLSVLLNAIKANTDYSVYGKNTWITDDSSEVFIMAHTGQNRDMILRQSIDFLNEVFYQQESGEWVIATLSNKNMAPFSIDVTNKTATTMVKSSGNQQITPSLFNIYFTDNSYDTPLYCVNYGMVPPNIVSDVGVNSFVVSVVPNLKYFPRMQQLKDSSWFVGEYDYTEINGNIVSDPAMRQAFNQKYVAENPYLNFINGGSDGQGNSKKVNTDFNAYQLLLSFKDMSRQLTNYQQFGGTFLLDDPAFYDADGNALVDLGNLLGKIVPINNCIMESGIIATTSRNYGEDGIASLSINLAPLGSITGKWAS